MNDFSKLPRYACLQVVRAAKIVDINNFCDPVRLILDCGIEVGVDAEWLSKHSPQKDWYFVVYENGQQSCYPADAFDNDRGV